MHGARMESGEIPLHLEIGGEMSELNVPVKGISRRSLGVRTVTWTAAYAASPNRLLRLSIVS